MLRVLPLLGWVLIPGYASFVTSSPERRECLGRPMFVICEYDNSYAVYKKYWCRGATWSSCEIVVKTTESEAEVKVGRTSIKDNLSHSEFMVRLDNLTEQDAGIYWCAIERTGYDLRFRVNITVLAECASLTSSPEWSGFLGRSLSVVCEYNSRYVSYQKYWCRGAPWGSCEIVVQTTRSEEEVKNGRTSIKDSHSHSEFMVHLDNLTEQDAGIYWCAIERKGYDFGFRVNIIVLPVPTAHPEEGSRTIEEGPSRNPPSAETSGFLLYSSRLYVPFLISISLKTPIFLCMVAIIWMRRKNRQHRGEAAPP